MSLIDLNSLPVLTDDELTKIATRVNEEAKRRELAKDYDVLKHGIIKFGIEFKSGSTYVVKTDQLKAVYSDIKDDAYVYRADAIFAYDVNGSIFTLMADHGSDLCVLRKYHNYADFSELCSSNDHVLTIEQGLELLQMFTDVDLRF